jgi:two-component system, cell cycle sensor histidine kinase and response regulator CckA
MGENSTPRLSAPILGQLLLMQSALSNLPDEEAIFSFVCRGLEVIPGVAGVSYSVTSKEMADASLVSFPLGVGLSDRGAILIEVSDPTAFVPYDSYLKNFCFTVAVILEERHQRRLIEEHRAQLEKGIQERTKQLTKEINARSFIEEELRRGRNMLAHILNSVPQSIFWKDRNSVYLGCNEVFARAVGLNSPDQIVGKTDFDLPWPRDEAEAYRADDREVMTSETAKRHIVEPLQQADGTRLWINTTKVPLMDQDNNVYGVLGVYEDITERKIREIALLESEERFRLTFQTSPDSISINGLSDGLYLDINDGFTAMTGYSREEVIGRSAAELNIWHSPQDRRRLIRSLREAGYVNNMEARFRLKDGTVITGLISARVIMLKGEPHIVSITRNIEEWRRTQEALRESEQRYRSLFEESIDGVYSVLRDGQITDANASFCRLFGYTKQEMIGKPMGELYSDPAERLRFQREIEQTGFLKDYEVKLRKKDRTEIDCLLTSAVHLGPDGSIVGYRGILRDLTSRKALQRQLLQAQKMEAIGTLAGGMAHDFNNLLQAILGYSDLLLMKKDPDDVDRKKIEVIQHAARDGADLVARILTFSRRAESLRRPVDLNEEILKAQKLVSRTVPRMIEIKLVLAENLAIIDADPAQIEQILLNLVVNAQHAMPDGGQLLIETSNISLSREYLSGHLGAKPGKYVLLSVSDTGVGIARDVQDRIFEPFFTTKTDGEGTGLGLAMVHGIVSQHGGHIRCYSEPDIGTSFKIYFPVSATEQLWESAETGEMPLFGNETILLVDDDDRVREMAQEMIRQRGYQVLTARSGEEALEVYAAHRNISLIVLDLIMPGMGGKKCLEELLRVDPAVRVIVASGYSSVCLSQEEREMGAIDFISKPYDAKDILGAIRTALDKIHPPSRAQP